MKKNIKLLFLFSFLMFVGEKGVAQAIISTQWGDYIPSNFPGYGALHPDAAGVFMAAIGKSNGNFANLHTVEAETAIVVLTLAPEVPWDGSPITSPAGWAFDSENSTPTNIVFINTVDWVDGDDEPVFEIPVRALQARSSRLTTVGTQVFNGGGSWSLHPEIPDKFTAVTVEDVKLPVLLTTFNAKVEGNQTNLSWSTTLETNSDRFEVERSANAKNWQKIGTVKSHGESTVLRDYKLTDGAPLAGLNYYRLKMVDKDATYDYSRIVSADFASQSLYVYPNPSSGNFRINENLIVNSLELTNVSGQVIPASFYKIKENNQIEAEALAAGLYLIKIKQENGTVTVHKLMISK